MKRLYILIMCLSAQFGFSQNAFFVQELLNHLDSTTDKSFFYKSEWIDSLAVIGSFDEEDYLSVLERSIAAAGLNIYLHEDKHVFIYPNRIEFNKQKILSELGVSNSIEFLQIGDPSNYHGDNTFLLSGSVSDESGKPLIGVNVTINGDLASRTNNAGSFSLNLNPGNYEIGFSYVGLESEKRFITFYSSGHFDISLFPDAQFLDEVIVEGSSLENSSGKTKVGVQKISLAKLEKLPSFLGNVDVVKSATALPGVSVSGESSSYLNVRGGTNDQTLVLMDNTTIYNPGHLLGFFSVFNGDFISDMTLYKGNIPARYGMRASSVLDVKMNKWATKKYNIYGGVGLINSNLGVKSKLIEDKLDIHIGGRLSYIDWVLDLIPDKDVLQSRARFGDANFSSRLLLNDNNTFFVSGYFGNDFFKYSDRIIYKWRTLNGALRWSRLLDKGWVIETELSHSSLLNSSEGLELNEEFVFDNGISELSLKGAIGNEEIEVGLDLSTYTINLGEIDPAANNSLVEHKSIEKEQLLNIAGHVSYIFQLGDRFEINPGLRVDYFANYGPTDINVYAGSIYTPQNIEGTQSFGAGEISSSRFALSPRVGLNYKINNHTIQSSYSRINQFLHLISNTVLVNPSTIWKGSDKYISPTVIDQFSLGYQFRFDKEGISVSVDGFYKSMMDLVDYRDGASLILNEHLEQVILRGKGQSYGFEFLISKDKGMFSGLISYTYSRTLATVDDKMQRVEINSGESYPYYTDRPHSVKASLDFKATKKWTISSNFIYMTGAPISAPITIYEIDNIRVPYFSERNSERMPNYHRMDLVVTLKSRIRKTKRNNDRWVLTIYNLYGRDNVANIYFSSDNDAPSQPFQLVNVGKIVPTLTYKFEF